MAVGWDAKSWGYHSEGELFVDARCDNVPLEGYKEGDTVGSAVRFKEKQAFFTKGENYLVTG
ncbi:hypothetical protein F4859DRAFT_496031 [Xylaria cf. heliscus]|nr:hypothetical protein F4859DRAFT_496031 [Xylaria cf. heliscus]